MEKGEQTMAEWILSDKDLGMDGTYYNYHELIRCKECKWHKPKYPGERPTCLIYLGDWHDDDYCSRAERKEE